MWQDDGLGKTASDWQRRMDPARSNCSCLHGRHVQGLGWISAANGREAHALFCQSFCDVSEARAIQWVKKVRVFGRKKAHRKQQYRRIREWLRSHRAKCRGLVPDDIARLLRAKG